MPSNCPHQTGSPYKAEAWYVGKVANKEILHERLLKRGVVGDFVLAESVRGGLSLVCKIAEGRLSFPHIITSDEAMAMSLSPTEWTTPWQVQMEGSKHVLKSVYHLLEHIAPIARTPARELVVDTTEEDSYVRDEAHKRKEQVYDVAWGCRTLKHNGGGFFKATDIARFDSIYDVASTPPAKDDVAYSVASGRGTASAESDSVYDVAACGSAMARLGKPTSVAQTDDVYAFASSGDIYDPATMVEEPVYALPEPVRGSSGAAKEAIYSMATKSAGSEAIYSMATKSANTCEKQDAVYSIAAGSGRVPIPTRRNEERAVYDVASSARPS